MHPGPFHGIRICRRPVEHKFECSLDNAEKRADERNISGRLIDQNMRTSFGSTHAQGIPIGCLAGAFSIHRNEDIGDMIAVRVTYQRVGCNTSYYGKYVNEVLRAVELPAILFRGRFVQWMQMFGAPVRGIRENLHLASRHHFENVFWPGMRRRTWLGGAA
jgi:hypothetical protein